MIILNIRAKMALFIVLGLFTSVSYGLVNPKATKGALVEAAFIIQNKANSLKDLSTKLAQELKDAQVAAKKLDQEKGFFEENLKRHQSKLEHDQERQRAQIMLALHSSVIESKKCIQDFYPEFIEMVDYFSGILLQEGTTLTDKILSCEQTRFEVRKAQLLHTLADTYAVFIKQMLDLQQQAKKVELEEQAEKYYAHALVQKKPDNQLKKLQNKSHYNLKLLKQELSRKQHSFNKIKQNIHSLQEEYKKLNLTKYSADWFNKKVDALCVACKKYTITNQMN
jgi:hypothetical protein